MRSSNPVFKTIERDYSATSAEAASYGGLVAKTALLFLFAVVSGYFAITTAVAIENLFTLLIIAMVVALISMIVATRSVRLAMPFAIIFALAEGVLLGFITALAELYVPGAAVTAIIGTAAIFIVMLFLYSSRTIRVTSRYRRIMMGILFGILVFFIVFGILSLIGAFPQGISYPLAIGISIFLIVYGAFMLAMDFDRAESIVEGGADKRYEWMVAIGLMVTIVWIYIEILRLILILASRRD
ncbi:MAG: Bax inhibitor-1/YccA family protein [Acholeplasmataceae bacterium]|nr:Bax inhibitor-1/YccA family protein [Acholeplasmataceae bacterium]